MKSHSDPEVAQGRKPLRLHRFLALGLFILLLAASTTQAFFVFVQVQRLAEEAVVIEAASVLSRFESILQASLAETGLQTFSSAQELQAIQKAVAAFPARETDFDLYLVAEGGEILANLSSQNLLRKVVDVAPLKKFETLPRTETPLIHGDDPATVSGKAPFVALRLREFRGEPYLYLVLERNNLLRQLKFRFDEFLPRLAGIVLLAQVLVALGVAWFISRFLTRRIRSLSSAMSLFRNGDFSTKIKAEGRDELAELAELANSMASRIQQNISELEQRDHLRRELIANVSHDLRTPASVLQGYSSLLLESHRRLLPEEQESMYSALHSGALSLGKLLDQLWDLSRLEAKERMPEKEKFCVGELASEIVEQLQAKAREKEIELSERIVEPLPLVFADPALIHRALSNLIENALSYTPSGGKILVEVIPGPLQVKICVRDTGVGFSMDQLPSILQRSVRGNARESTNEKAGGLGLAIVQRILELHGREILVESIENQGSVFGFELPCADKN